VSRYFVFFSLLLLVVSGCHSYEKEASLNRFSDSTYVRINEFQDRRSGDSLVAFLQHKSPDYRRQALIALGSVQDSTIVDRIGTALRDKEATVRLAAAFTLGQTKCAASEQLLHASLQAEREPQVLAKLYESYGRVTRKWEWMQIPTDTTVAAGFAWGLFRAAPDSLLNPLAEKLLQSPAVTVRLGAAHYFSRKAPNPRAMSTSLLKVARRDESAYVRMAATLALKKIPTEEVFNALKEILIRESSASVRINAISALQDFPGAKPVLVTALKDQSLNVAIRAAEVINSQPADYSVWQEMVGHARAARNYRVKALLYQFAMKSNERDQGLFKEIRALYASASDPYVKAALMAALGKTLIAFSFVQEELAHADVAVVRTAAASALVSMNYNERTFVPALQGDFVKAYRAAIKIGDLAVCAVICDALTDPSLHYKDVIKDWQFLYDAQKRLRRPDDSETLQLVNNAIAHFEGKEAAPTKNEFNHPIDWRLVHSIAADQTAIIETTKGRITIRLLVDEAPGSVANFVGLVNSGTYREKFFHRVVPNFVVQGGCPRGDGYGGEDYTIRSEFSLRKYKTGSVGMASSGKDTESTQWFITHSPTPHLDGSYTIFAEVVYGMDIVGQLEVGDKIMNIELRQ
jgi:cyclophilin family peptidyl-prolyl cis-trans isomerase/HEAT repeat protein